MTVRKIHNDLWTITEPGKPKVQLMFFNIGNGWYQFIVAEYRARRVGDQLQSVLLRELFSTRIFTLEASTLLKSFVQHYLSCRDVMYPIELAYLYGGEIHNEKIKFLLTTTRH